MFAGAGRPANAVVAKKDHFPKDYIPPTWSEAEQSEEKFYELIAYYRQTRKLTHERLAEPLGINQSTVYRKLEEKKFTPDQRKLALDYIFVDSPIAIDPSGAGINRVRDALYFAFEQFCHVKLTTQHTAAAEAVGVYQFWRYSVEDPGLFVHGRIDIERDKRSQALCVRMQQPGKAKDGLRSVSESASGYFFPAARIYGMILRDPSNKDLRVTLFPHFRKGLVGTDHDPKSVFPGSLNHLVQMDAFVMGVDGRDFFFSPLYFELIDDREELAALDQKLDVLPETEVPVRVLNKLKRYPFVQK